MTRQNVQIVLVAVVLIGAAGMAAAQTEEVVHVIAMEPGGRFTLGNISGEITVTGVDGDHLTIRATKRVAGRGSGAAAEQAGQRLQKGTPAPRVVGFDDDPVATLTTGTPGSIRPMARRAASADTPRM